MAQTTEYYSLNNCKCEFSVNGSAWTNASGWTNLVEWDGFEKEAVYTHTFDGSTPIMAVGKPDGGSVKFRAIYTENAADIVAVAQSAFDNDTAFYMRWSPRGGTSGQKQYTTAAGRIVKPLYPQGEHSSEVLAIEVEMVTTAISIATVA